MIITPLRISNAHGNVCKQTPSSSIDIFSRVAVGNKPLILFSTHGDSRTHGVYDDISPHIPIPVLFKDRPPKIVSILRLIRYKNIMPTLALGFSGGWLMNPSFLHLCSSPIFLTSIWNTISIMSTSMILNDIFDIEIDKINNPYRPLVCGEITKREAILYSGLLIGSSELLSRLFLPVFLRNITRVVSLLVFIYTPFLKRILFMKNLTCATIVAFSVYYAGIAATVDMINMSKGRLIKHKGLLSIATLVVFSGSLCNEIIMDICDYHGDKKNGVVTVPIMFGKQNALFVVSTIFKINMFVSSALVSVLFRSIFAGGVFTFLSYPFLEGIHKIHVSRFSDDVMRDVISNSTEPLIAMLLFLCFLSSF
jgi:4-hydroxybenzoate polyprenyltransferase